MEDTRLKPIDNKSPNLKANSDITNLEMLNIECRKVKRVKLYSENDYGDVNPDEIELNNLMPNQANLNFLYADVNKIFINRLILINEILLIF
jgi:hypothetical protein